MPAFSADREDEERLKTYILQRVPPGLKRALDIYRTETFAGAQPAAFTPQAQPPPPHPTHTHTEQSPLVLSVPALTRTQAPTLSVCGDKFNVLIGIDLDWS